MTTHRRTRRSERGTMIVEAAIVMPIVILLILGAVDVGSWVFETTEAASSARDGARVGTLSYLTADVPGSADALAVGNAIRRRLGNRVILPPEIRCVSATDTSPLAGGCATASVINLDRIRVAVSWQRPGLGLVTRLFGGNENVSATALMTLNGLPRVAPAP